MGVVYHGNYILILRWKRWNRNKGVSYKSMEEKWHCASHSFYEYQLKKSARYDDLFTVRTLFLKSEFSEDRI
jgi:acyl-CoA thioester hydrolase